MAVTLTDGNGQPWRCRSCQEELAQVKKRASGLHYLRYQGAEIEGDALIVCSCGSVRRWVPGELLMERIIERNKKRIARAMTGRDE